MRKYIERAILKALTGFMRKLTNLEREIIEIIDEKTAYTKADIVSIIEDRCPDCFSAFEIEYTIDRMVCDKKIMPSRYGGYVSIKEK